LPVKDLPARVPARDLFAQEATAILEVSLGTWREHIHMHGRTSSGWDSKTLR
jgi:hypothetical protein